MDTEQAPVLLNCWRCGPFRENLNTFVFQFWRWLTEVAKPNNNPFPAVSGRTNEKDWAGFYFYAEIIDGEELLISMNVTTTVGDMLEIVIEQPMTAIDSIDYTGKLAEYLMSWIARRYSVQAVLQTAEHNIFGQDIVRRTTLPQAEWQPIYKNNVAFSELKAWLKRFLQENKTQRWHLHRGVWSRPAEWWDVDLLIPVYEQVTIELFELRIVPLFALTSTPLDTQFTEIEVFAFCNPEFSKSLGLKLQQEFELTRARNATMSIPPDIRHKLTPEVKTLHFRYDGNAGKLFRSLEHIAFRRQSEHANFSPSVGYREGNHIYELDLSPVAEQYGQDMQIHKIVYQGNSRILADELMGIDGKLMRKVDWEHRIIGIELWVGATMIEAKILCHISS